MTRQSPLQSSIIVFAWSGCLVLFIKPLSHRQIQMEKGNEFEAKRKGKVLDVDATKDDDDDEQVEQPIDNPLRYLSQDKWKLDTNTELFIRDLPKVELHVHFDGAFDTDVLWNYLQEKEMLWCLPVSTILPWDQSVFPVRQRVLDCQNADDFRKLCTCRGQRSLVEMLKCFELFTPVVRDNLELLEHLAYDFCRRQAQQHVMYTEVRYSPHFLAEGGQLNSNNEANGDEKKDPTLLLDRAEEVLQTITKGLRRGCRDFGVTIHQILCAITWRPDWAMHVVDLAEKYRHDTPCAVVGVDIAAGEEHFDQDQYPNLFQPHFEMIQRAKDLGISITLHAGEVGLAENVSKAVQDYGATRIGHGYRMQSDTRQLLRQHNIHVEVCPTSSAETGGWDYNEKKPNWQNHPIMDMLRDGLSVSINSDDPAVFDTSLSWQYRILLGKAGLSKEDAINMTRDAIHAAFCDADEKERLFAMLQDYLEQGKSRNLNRSSSLPPFRKASFHDRVRSHISF